MALRSRACGNGSVRKREVGDKVDAEVEVHGVDRSRGSSLYIGAIARAEA